jgi:hypothetical protein
VKLILLAVLLAGCSSMSGLLGTDVHLVDSYWIGAERPCADGDPGLECRTVIEAALSVLPAGRSPIAKATLADLPTEFRTLSGEVRRVRLSRGLDTWKAIVLDLVDGTREVAGFRCYVPYGLQNVLLVSEVQCWSAPLVDWHERDAPAPSI